MMIKWDPSLETGNDRIDDQHKIILGKLGEFHNECAKGLKVRAVLELFNFIENYIKSHFVLEEAYMFSHKYPELEIHHQAHEDLKAAYRSINARLEGGETDAVKALKEDIFLGDWWLEHINNADKIMVAWIAKQIRSQHTRTRPLDKKK